MLTATTVQHGTKKSEFVSRTVTLQPGSAKSVGLGVYDVKTGAPSFQVVLEPEVTEEIFSSSVERLEVPGHDRYMLIYKFKNHDNQPRTVTVKRLGR